MKIPKGNGQNHHTTLFLHDVKNHYLVIDLLEFNGMGGMEEFFEKGEPKMKGFTHVGERHGVYPQSANRIWKWAVWIERQRWQTRESVTFTFMVKNLYGQNLK
jgi:hypothetical protein